MFPKKRRPFATIFQALNRRPQASCDAHSGRIATKDCSATATKLRLARKGHGAADSDSRKPKVPVAGTPYPRPRWTPVAQRPTFVSICAHLLLPCCELNIVRKLSASSYVQVTLAASRVRDSDGVFQSNRLGRMID